MSRSSKCSGRKVGMLESWVSYVLRIDLNALLTPVHYAHLLKVNKIEAGEVTLLVKCLS